MPGLWGGWLRGRDVLVTLWIGALLVATWPLLAAPPIPAAPFVPIVAHISGMLAGYGVLVLLLLVSRMPALERDIGADILSRANSRIGRIVVTLVIVHGVCAVLAWAGALSGRRAWGRRPRRCSPCRAWLGLCGERGARCGA